MNNLALSPKSSVDLRLDADFPPLRVACMKKLSKSSTKYPTATATVDCQPVVNPRSAAEANQSAFDNKAVPFRQLPCKTVISVGTCPFRERCVYLHDPRCMAKDAKTKTRKKNKDDVGYDSLFWPTLPIDHVNKRLDVDKKPHIIQAYHVPDPQLNEYYLHDIALYSIWNHFVEFCVNNAEGNINYDSAQNIKNRFTSNSRLNYLVKLSQSSSPTNCNQGQFAVDNTYPFVNGITQAFLKRTKSPVKFHSTVNKPQLPISNYVTPRPIHELAIQMDKSIGMELISSTFSSSAFSAFTRLDALSIH